MQIRLKKDKKKTNFSIKKLKQKSFIQNKN